MACSSIGLCNHVSGNKRSKLEQYSTLPQLWTCNVELWWICDNMSQYIYIYIIDVWSSCWNMPIIRAHINMWTEDQQYTLEINTPTVGTSSRVRHNMSTTEGDCGQQGKMFKGGSLLEVSALWWFQTQTRATHNMPKPFLSVNLSPVP